MVLYDKEPAGVVTVRFSDPDAARQCVEVRLQCLLAVIALLMIVVEYLVKMRKSQLGVLHTSDFVFLDQV